MVDSHCHLADPAFTDDLDDVIERARAAGVTQALCVVDALEVGEAERAATMRERWPVVRLAVGVHPHRAAAFQGRAAESANLVRSALAGDRGVRAIGEIGLDYHYDFSPPAVQRGVFEAQVALASEVGLPIVIHTRAADRDTIEVLQAAGPGAVTGVFHCFSGDVGLARQALDLGFSISFSGIVTFPKATAVRDAARFVPDDRLLTETDCPYLAPVPRRGSRNEPSLVAHVVECLAELRGSVRERVTACVAENYQRLFHP